MSEPKVYASIIDGAVREIVLPYVDASGYEWPVEQRFSAEFIATLVDITEAVPQPDQLWTYTNGVFAAPLPPYVDPRPAIVAELDDINRTSIGLLRSLVITTAGIGEDTPERAELEALDTRAAELKAELVAIENN